MSNSITGNTGAPFVVVNYAGPANGSVTADFYGVYTISGLNDGSYQLTPVLATFNFSPTSLTEVIAGADLTDINFQAAGISAIIGSVATIHSFDGTAGYLLVNKDTLLFFNIANVTGQIAVGDAVYFRWPLPTEEEEAYNIVPV